MITLKKVTHKLFPALAQRHKIKKAISELSLSLSEKHKEALKEGYKDELCPKCGAVYLAHHHFVACGLARCGECPMVSKSDPRSLLKQLMEEDE